MASTAVTVREYRDGDEAVLVELWNQSYKTYAGYVLRNQQHWRWCVLERPGIGDKDILIADINGTAVGYAVLAPGGKVIEFAVDPAPSSREREKLADLLISALEDRGCARGYDDIRFQVPYPDEPICRALRRRVYASGQVENLQWVILDLPGFLSKLLSHREARFPKNWSPTILLQLEPGYYNFHPHPRLSIEIGPPAIIVVDPPTSSYEININTDLSLLTDLIFRKTTFEEAVASGRLEIQPESATEDVKTFIHLISVANTWYTPLADAR